VGSNSNLGSADDLRKDLAELFERDALSDASLLQDLIAIHRRAVGFKHPKVAERIESAMSELQWSVRMKLQYDIGMALQKFESSSNTGEKA
jgi:hypothetical protein